MRRSRSCWPRTRAGGGSDRRSSRSGGVAGLGGVARSRAWLRPGDQKSASDSSSGWPVTSDSTARAGLSSGGRSAGPLAGARPAAPPPAAPAVPPGAHSAQRGEQFVTALAAPGQHRERVVVERLRQHVADRRHVLARESPVRAVAVHRQVARRTRGKAECRRPRRPARSRRASRPPAAGRGTAPGRPAATRPSSTARRSAAAPRGSPCTASGATPARARSTFPATSENSSTWPRRA